jgi:hypothetical protein
MMFVKATKGHLQIQVQGPNEPVELVDIGTEPVEVPDDQGRILVGTHENIVEVTDAPVESEAPEESEETDDSTTNEVVHIGGPWFEINGQKVKGRAAAEAIAAGG